MPRTDACDRPQANKCELKSKQGNTTKMIEKSAKKLALSSYLDTIETTLTEIFNETTKIWGFIRVFFLYGFFSLIGSSLVFELC
jgi:hypothetical protein